MPALQPPRTMPAAHWIAPRPSFLTEASDQLALAPPISV
jgi:hypothetical protein